MDCELTVLIPTYNRREPLLNLLTGLSEQTCSYFKIIISDNASDYDVHEVINVFGEEFKKRITLYVRPFNIGGSVNILECFSLCKTRWAWMLSDDDFVKKDAVESIYKWIKRKPNCGCFNFTLCNMVGFTNQNYIELSDIDHFIANYKKYPEYHGDLIFMSNKVYNMPIVSRYLIEGFKTVNSGLFITVIFAKLVENHVPFICVNKKIVEFNDEGKRAWDPSGIVLGTRIIADVKYSFDRKRKKELVKIQCFKISTVYKLYFVLQEAKSNDKYFIEKIYHGLYKYILPLPSKILLRIIVSTSKFSVGYGFWRAFFWLYFGGLEKAIDVVKKSKYKSTIKRFILWSRK